MVSSSGLALWPMFVGVYYGLNMLQIPNEREVLSLCLKHNISRIRLHQLNTKMLKGLGGNYLGVRFTFDLPNKVLNNLNDDFEIKNWFETFVNPFTNDITIEYIVVGEDGHKNIVPTMKLLRRLLDMNFLGDVKLTTMISYSSSLAIKKDPPSTGTFNPRIKDNMRAVFNYFIEYELLPDLMVNLYPFKKYVYDNKGVVSINYATFDGTDTVKDGPFTYHNLFDAMVDTIYAAIDELKGENFFKIRVVVGETGWPTEGRGADTSIALASKYNQKLIAHVNSGKGTPRRPKVSSPVFIRSLFNEDARPIGESQYYGIFNTNFTPIYPLFHATRMNAT